MFYFGQMVVKNIYTVQSIHIVKTRSQPMKPRVAAFMVKIECKKYPKVVCNFMLREQQMQIARHQAHHEAD